MRYQSTSSCRRTCSLHARLYETAGTDTRTTLAQSACCTRKRGARTRGAYARGPCRQCQHRRWRPRACGPLRPRRCCYYQRSNGWVRPALECPRSAHAHAHTRAHNVDPAKCETLSVTDHQSRRRECVRPRTLAVAAWTRFWRSRSSFSERASCVAEARRRVTLLTASCSRFAASFCFCLYSRRIFHLA